MSSDVAAPRTAADPFEGTAYRAVERLGAGGMGEVFLVAHRQVGRQYVAKVLHTFLAADARLVDRARVEAEALGRLSHPNVVAAVGFEMTRDGRPFVITERLVGRSLQAELKARGRLPLPLALRYARELLSALGAAHAIGVVHRDVKPDNVFLASEPGQAPSLKVLDFGIARVLPEAPDGAPLPLSVPTEPGVVVGSARYVSPEGAMGQKVDHRADLYAAGLVSYVMLTGTHPFEHARTQAEVLMAHTGEQPPPPSAFVPELPPELDAVVLRSLQKDPAARYQTARDMAAALERVSVAAAADPRTESLPGDFAPPEPGADTRTIPPTDAAAMAPALLPGVAPPRTRAIVFVAVTLVTAVAVALGVSGVVTLVRHP